VLITKNHCPLALLGNRWSLFKDIDDRKPVLHLQRHEDARHERKVEIHVRFVAIAEVSSGIFRPLVRLRKQHAIWKFSVDVSAQFAEVLMRFWQIFAARVLSLVKVRDRVETKPIYAQTQPEIADFLHGIVHGRVIKVQVWLM